LEEFIARYIILLPYITLRFLSNLQILRLLKNLFYSPYTGI